MEFLKIICIYKIQCLFLQRFSALLSESVHRLHKQRQFCSRRAEKNDTIVIFLMRAMGGNAEKRHKKAFTRRFVQDVSKSCNPRLKLELSNGRRPRDVFI